MKLQKSIAKNLKLLFRSRETAYTIILGPLLIILLVSFAFKTAGDDYTINVGTYAPKSTDYSDRTTNALQAKGYAITNFAQLEPCLQAIRSGAMHVCIAFSEREVGNGTVPVAVYMDLGKTNVVYQIADDLSASLELQTDAIRTKLASDALTRMKAASGGLHQGINISNDLEYSLLTLEEQIASTRIALAGISNSSLNESDARVLKGYQLGLAGQTRLAVNKSVIALDDTEEVLRSLERECNCTQELLDESAAIRDEIDNLRKELLILAEDDSKEMLFDANIKLEFLLSDIRKLNLQLQNDSVAKAEAGVTLEGAGARAGRNAKSMTQLREQLEQSNELLQGQQADANTISNPTETTITNITTDDKLGITYPYLLTLVIMFIGMLLASMLIVEEKTSRAAFRNFTTPTSSRYHITAAFLTALIVLLAETGVIMLLSSLFVPQPLHLWSLTTLTLVCLTIILFTFLGMIIGYLCGTQQTAMIASISIGSVLLFVSNLIIPIEGMAKAVQFLTAFNPYVVLGELLRKSMLYGVSFGNISRQISVILLLCVALFGLTLFIHQRLRKQYFRQEDNFLVHVPAPLSLHGRQIHNEVELLDLLDHMTRQEFEQIVTQSQNPIAHWAKTELRSRGLARKLNTTSKERMIIKLDEHLKAHGKRIS
jgi:ABC-type multidrug transport system permease subunit